MKINVEQLKTILENLKPGLSGANETTEQSNCFAFTKDRIHTYNDEISISAPNPIEFEGAIQSVELLLLLNKLKTKDAEIEFTEQELIIKSGKIKAGIILQKEIMMPVEEITIPSKWLKIPSDFLEALSTCIFTVSSDEDVEILTYISCNKNMVVSSDNERATRYTMKSKLNKSFLIPALTAKNLIHMEDLTGYNISEEWIHFKTDSDVVFSSRCSFESYLDTDSYFEMNGNNFTFPENTKELLERARIFAESNFTQDELVQISITTKGVFKIFAEGESGWIEETKRVRHKSIKDIQFSINPQYLQQILDKIGQATIGDKFVWFNIDNFEHVVALEE